MARAEFRVSLPEDTWAGTVSRAHPDATLSVLSVVPTERGGVALVTLRADDAPEVVRAIEDDPSVAEVDLQQVAREAREVVLRVETTDPRLLTPLSESRLPVELPVTVEDGRARLTVAGSRDRISALASALDALDITYDVGFVHAAHDARELLTEGQRELLAAAIDAGYYDTPRGTSLTELAERHGIAKSTASERLHRAEGKVIKRFAEDALPVDPTDDARTSTAGP